MGRIREIKKQVRHKEWAAMVQECQTSGKNVEEVPYAFLSLGRASTKPRLVCHTAASLSTLDSVVGIISVTDQISDKAFKEIRGVFALSRRLVIEYDNAPVVHLAVAVYPHSRYRSCFPAFLMQHLNCCLICVDDPPCD